MRHAPGRHTYRRIAGRWRAVAAGCSLALLTALVGASLGMARGGGDDTGPSTVDPKLLQGLEWRNVGPNRASRSIAVAGSPSRPDEYYAGQTGGGLWKTTDRGENWEPVTDQQLTSSSVGAVAVCEANPDVVYVGMGEVQWREKIIPGDGVYKSTDGGETWTHIGLADSQTVSRIRIDQSDCDKVYAAVMGHPFGPNEERGVFRSSDGGASWQRVLYQGDQTGAADLIIDRSNPNVLYAGMWHAFMRPWGGTDGGEGSGVYKSTDGGSSWTDLTDNPGLPDGLIGKVGVAVAGSDPNRVYAMLSSENNPGLYRSDDAGATWRMVNDDGGLRARPHYYTRVYVDPQDPDVVWVLADRLFKSTDGGQTFGQVSAPHADHHDLWIDPNDSQRIVNANDGGANVTFDGGASWTEQDYSAAQMYGVMTTDHVPYLVCGGQQEHTTACVSSEGVGDEFFSVGGSESAVVAVDPRDTQVFYAGNYGGTSFTRYDQQLPFQRRRIDVWPEIPFGHAPKELKERFAWSVPIVTTPADARAVYTTSQHVHRTTNRGQSWERISPDLTRADPATLELPFGPIYFHPNSSYTYATLSALAPSRIKRGLIWVGSDDGLIHVTRNGGRSWTNVTPPDLPEYATVSKIDPSPHDPGTAYATAWRYKLDDRGLYVYKTDDYGRTWTKITNGIAADDFARAIREDTVREGLLYLGTEHGIYVSFDDGANWQSLRQNLPDTQVRDLIVKDDDVVIGTFGRGFYVMDDVSPLRQMTRAALRDEVHLYDPTDARMSVDEGVTVTYHLTRAVDDVRIELLDRRGRRVGTIDDAPGSVGMHRRLWRPPTDKGTFTVRLTAGGERETERVEVTPGPPRSPDALADADEPRPAVAERKVAEEGSTFRLFDPADPIRLVNSGVTVEYSLSEPAQDVRLEFLDDRGRVIRTFTGSQVPTTVGDHSFTWNLRYPGPTLFEGISMPFASTNGPRAPWGRYVVRLVVDGESARQRFEIKGDPRLEGVGPAHIREQFRLAMRIRDRTSDANEGVIAIRACRDQIEDRIDGAAAEVVEEGTRLAEALGVIERALYQTELVPGVSWEGVEPLRLNNEIAYLLGIVESAEDRPTDQTYEVFNLLSGRLDDQLTALAGLFDEDVPAFNELLREHGLEPIACG